MRTLLALICSLALISLAGAAQQQSDQDNPNPKGKKGQSSQQVVAQPAPAKIKGSRFNANANLQQPTTTHYQSTGKHAKNWQGPVTGGSSTNLPVTHYDATGKNAKIGVNSTNLPVTHYDATGKNAKGQTSTNVNVPAKNTTFNKSLTVNKNITINKNFKVQHFNLGNQPSGKYQAVKFNGNFHIAGAQNWKGSKYVVFQNYHPQWHDQGWWHSHHNHIVFVFGSPYYWDSGYWYPAWGYNPGASYYYDGPIYASNPEMDPGQVVANVQTALQEQGFYQGDIDGVLGPQTRAALAEFQSAQGLEPTGVVDEPTLETLGMV